GPVEQAGVDPLAGAVDLLGVAGDLHLALRPDRGDLPFGEDGDAAVDRLAAAGVAGAPDNGPGALLRAAGDAAARGEGAGRGEADQQRREQETKDVKLDLHGDALFGSRRTWKSAGVGRERVTFGRGTVRGISPSSDHAPRA